MHAHITFKYELERGKSIAIVLEGEVEDDLLEAVVGYVDRARKRLAAKRAINPTWPATPTPRPLHSQAEAAGR